MSGHLFDLDRIVATMADAALNSEKWGSAMDEIAAHTGSFGAVLLPPHIGQRSFPSSQSLQRVSETYVDKRWNEKDERYRGVNILMRHGIFTDFDITTPDRIKRNPFYQDFLGAFRLSGFAGIKIGARDDVWALSIQRTIEQAHYQPDELNALRRLNLMTQSVFATAQALGFAKGEATLDAFDAMDRGAVLLNRKLEIVRSNAALEHVLDDNFRLIDKKFRFADADTSLRFSSTLYGLMGEVASVSAQPITILKSDGSSIVAYAMRNPALTDSPFSPFAAIVVFVDLDARVQPSTNTLKVVFGMTPAEARLALALAAGWDVAAEAQRTGLSRETLKTHLRSIFAKTSTKRQAELVAVLSQLLSGR